MGRLMKDKKFILVCEGEFEIASNDEPYHYEDCGLKGIYLLNGFETEEFAGEKYVTIHNVDSLHWAIGQHLAFHEGTLTKREIRFLRITMGLTQAELAAKIGNDTQTVARWEKGKTPIPGPSERLLRAQFLAMALSDEELTGLRQFLVEQQNEVGLKTSEENDCVVRFQRSNETETWGEQELALQA